MATVFVERMVALSRNGSAPTWCPVLYLGASDDPTTALMGLALERGSRNIQNESTVSVDLAQLRIFRTGSLVGFIDGVWNRPPL